MGRQRGKPITFSLLVVIVCLTLFPDAIAAVCHVHYPPERPVRPPCRYHPKLPPPPTDLASPPPAPKLSPPLPRPCLIYPRRHCPPVSPKRGRCVQLDD
ncbi:hypothetical protein QQP08_000971 [Theobroma cacao]|nr:hypothetical protein QQP08_000971 [Theobroma cacao]